jgi:hypothetical protein
MNVAKNRLMKSAGIATALTVTIALAITIQQNATMFLNMNI